MKRSTLLLFILALLLAAVLYWLLLFRPASDDIEQLDAEREDLEMQASEVEARIAALESVRESLPEHEAALAAAHNIVPSDPALPSLLRQVQQAADDSGATLLSVSTSRPAPVAIEDAPEDAPADAPEDAPADAPEDLASISVTIAAEGGYFQLVDMLRRIEEPAISPRGVLFTSLTVDADPEEYPVLNVAIAGEAYTLVPIAAQEEGADVPTEGDTDADGADDGDEEEDVDVDVEVTDGDESPDDEEEVTP